MKCSSGDDEEWEAALKNGLGGKATSLAVRNKRTLQVIKSLLISYLRSLQDMPVPEEKDKFAGKKKKLTKSSFR